MADVNMLRKAFAYFDKDGDGKLSHDDFRVVLTQTGDSTLTDQQVDAMFKMVDTDCNGSIDMDEFIAWSSSSSTVVKASLSSCAGAVRSFSYAEGFLEEGNDLLATSLTLQQAMQACADAGDAALGFCWNGDKDPTKATTIWVKSSASSSNVSPAEGWHTRLMLPPAQFSYHEGFLDEGDDLVSSWSSLSDALEASSGDKGSIGFCWSGDKEIPPEKTQVWVKNKDADPDWTPAEGWHTMLKVDDGSGDDDVLTMSASPPPTPQLDSITEEMGVWTGDALQTLSRAGDNNVGFAADPMDTILAALPSGARFVDAEFPPTASSVGSGTSVSAVGGGQSGASIPNLQWLRATQLLSGGGTNCRMSTQSVCSVMLHVINDLDHDVNVQWLGFGGETVDYAELPNGESEMEVETSGTHVWCFVDPESGDEDCLYVVPSDEGNDLTVTLSELQAQCQRKKADAAAGDAAKADEAKLFCQGTCSASDVMQGSIGDCWLMQSLASVANRFPDTVMASFNPCDGPSPSGVYTIKMWSPRRKHFFYMVVDDFLPTQDGSSPYFCRCNAQGSGMWVTLLEKAFAKIQGSYASLDSTACSDNPASALCRVLGGEAASREWFEEDHADLTASLELWEEMVARRSGGTSCSTLSSAKVHEGGESVDSHSGMVSFHGYTLMNLTEIEGFRLLKIRNVWGNTEWKGDWSDDSNLWDENPKVKEHCALEKKDDGIFWMAYPDFVKFFCMIWHN